MLEVTVKIEGFDEEGNPTADVQGEIIDGVVRSLSGKLEHGIRELVEKAFRSQLEQKLATAIDTLIGTSIQPTNVYGEKKGEPVSIVEYMAAKGSEYINETVSARTGGRPDYSDEKIPRAAWIARKMADEQLSKELKPAIDAAVKEAKAFMTTKVMTALKEAMAKAIQ